MASLLRLLPTFAVAALLGGASSAFAGYTATTNPFTATATDTTGNGPSIGDTLSVDGGSFLSFLGDTSQDPTISGGDLNRYRFDLDGTVTSFVGGGLATSFSGTYTIYYDQNANGMMDEGLRVSSGDFTLDTFLTGITGSFTQTQGPNNPSFADLGALYNNNPIDAIGTIVPNFNNPLASTTTLVLRQNAIAQPVPEPATMAALGLGALALIRRRRAQRA